MTRHLLRLVWNRKRTTLLVMVEIAVAFLVLFAVAAFATYALDNWRRPVGFTWDRVWDIEIDSNAAPSRMSETMTVERTTAATTRKEKKISMVTRMLVRLRFQTSRRQWRIIGPLL